MKKSLIIIAAVLLIVAAAWYYMNPGKNILVSLGIKKGAQPLPTDQESIKKLSDTQTVSAEGKVVQDERGFPLMPGSRNEYVKNIQAALNDRYGSSLVVDGIYGPKTQRALSAHGYQSTVYYKHYFEILGIQA